MSGPFTVLARQGSNLKLALLLGFAAAIATLALHPYLLMALPNVISKSHMPFRVLVIVSSAQAGLVCWLLSWLGLLLGNRHGLDAPWLRAIVDRQHNYPIRRANWGLAVIAGVLAGVLIVGLMWIVPGKSAPIEGFSPVSQAWRGALASFYGGIAEEIQLRLFMVSLLVWVLSGFNRRQAQPWVFVVAIVLAALLFGAGHLPAAFAMGMAHSPLVIGRIVLLNALVGLTTGALFWKYGLEHAMVAHFCADLILHVVLPLLSN